MTGKSQASMILVFQYSPEVLCRGTALLTRLAYYHPTYFKAFGFLAAFVPIDPDFDLKKALQATQKFFGYSLFGYWEFYSSDDAPKIIDGHVSQSQD